MKKVLFPILALVLALGLTVPMAASPGPGIVGLWHLDEESGTIAFDSSGNNLEGTLMGDATWGSGYYANAVSLDGDGDYVEVDDDVLLDITVELTIEAWVRTDVDMTTNPQMQIVDKGEHQYSSGYMLMIYNGNLIGRINKNSGTACSYAYPNDGEWHYVAYTFKSGEQKLVLDGSVVATNTGSAAITTNTQPLLIGRGVERPQYCWNGEIDEVRIWDEALSAGVIAEHAAAEMVLDKTMLADGYLGDIITVTLDGENPYTHNLTVTDEIPDGLRYVPGTYSGPGTPTVVGNTISVSVPPGAYSITFDVQVVEVQCQEVDVTNWAYLKDGATVLDSDSADITLHPYDGFFKEIVVGDDEVPLETDVHWLVVIEISNIPGDEIATMEDVVVKDRLGGDLELHCTVGSMGATERYTTGKTEKVHLTWDLDGDLGAGESAWLVLDISTDVNPGKGKNAPHQEYTEEGLHYLNSGAVVKFIDSEGTGFQLSAHTAPLEVEATDTAQVTESVLSLAQKDPEDWSIVEAGACGILVYDLDGTTFDFGFVASGLEATTGYSLIYYADPWPGDGGTHATGALIATMTTDSEGNALAFGSVDLGTDLPNPDDDNYSSPCACDPCPGAKIWLVLASHYSTTTPGVQGHMTGWNPMEYLFEYNSITYDDTDA